MTILSVYKETMMDNVADAPIELISMNTESVFQFLIIVNNGTNKTDVVPAVMLDIN